MEAANLLLGRPAKIRANDFVGAPIHGCIRFTDMKTNALVIELDTPLKVGNLQYGWAVASPRLARDDLDTLCKDGVLGCGITWVPSVRFNPSMPFDLGWWRGGAAAISDIVLD